MNGQNQLLPEIYQDQWTYLNALNTKMWRYYKNWPNETSWKKRLFLMLYLMLWKNEFIWMLWTQKCEDITKTDQMKQVEKKSLGHHWD